MQGEFDASTSTRCFAVGAMYHANFTAVPRFVQMLRREAPHIEFRCVVHRDSHDAAQMLDDGRTELAIGTLRDLPSRFRTQQIGSDRPICIARRDHPALIDGLDLEVFLRLPHACVMQGVDPAEEVDVTLSRQRQRRHIKLSLPGFYPLAVAIEFSDMLAVVPESVARALMLYVPITIHELPFDVPQWPLLMAWTAASEQDPGISWLRDFIVRVHEPAISADAPAGMQ